jgi:hypothetical protein
MSKFSVFNVRYDGLSGLEKIRQSERDSMLYEQTQELKELNKRLEGRDRDTSSSYSEPSIIDKHEGATVLWFSTFTFGGLLCLLYQSSMNKDLGNIPYILLGITLIVIPAIEIMRCKSKARAQRIALEKQKKERPALKREYNKVVKDYDKVQLEIEIEKEKLNRLNAELKIAIRNDNNTDVNILKKEILDTKEIISNYEDVFEELDKKVEELEMKIG